MYVRNDEMYKTKIWKHVTDRSESSKKIGQLQDWKMNQMGLLQPYHIHAILSLASPPVAYVWG